MWRNFNAQSEFVHAKVADFVHAKYALEGYLYSRVMGKRVSGQTGHLFWDRGSTCCW
jgi:hypothetical protein